MISSVMWGQDGEGEMNVDVDAATDTLMRECVFYVVRCSSYE